VPFHFTLTSGYVKIDFEEADSQLWYVPPGKDITFLGIGGGQWDLGGALILILKPA
jgi:hypothetical protein